MERRKEEKRRQERRTKDRRTEESRGEEKKGQEERRKQEERRGEAQRDHESRTNERSNERCLCECQVRTRRGLSLHPCLASVSSPLPFSALSLYPSLHAINVGLLSLRSRPTTSTSASAFPLAFFLVGMDDSAFCCSAHLAVHDRSHLYRALRSGHCAFSTDSKLQFDRLNRLLSWSFDFGDIESRSLVSSRGFQVCKVPIFVVGF